MPPVHPHMRHAKRLHRRTALKIRLQAFKFWAWSWVIPPALFDMAQRFVRRDRATNRTLSPPEHPTPLSGIMYPDYRRIYPEWGAETHWIPVEKIVNRYGQSFTTEQHHWVRYLESGFDDFERFFQIHQPKTALQRLFIDETFLDPAGTGVSGVPWLPAPLADDKAANAPASVPVSGLSLATEATRLDRIRHSIKKYGFLAGHAKPGGQIRYQIFLKDSDNFRILVLAGNHRTAVLAHLGWKLIPVHPLAGYHPVRLSDLADWPGVVDGRFTEELAHAMFEAFFRPRHQQLLPGW